MTMYKGRLADKIADLILLKQEGEYWDFKKEWYSNKADLLHDIICMSNNLTTEDGLIIIGVDEFDGFSIIDITNDNNRMSTQNIVDFLALEKCKVYLANKSEWEDSENGISYYKYSPEFTIQIISAGDERTGYEFYLFSQVDSTPLWYDINLFYQSTLILTTGGVALDGGRCFTSTPLYGCIQLERCRNDEIFYKYFIKDSIEYALHNFYINDEKLSDEYFARKRFLECVVIYNSESEKRNFENYIIENIEEFNNPVTEGYMPHFENLPGYDITEFEKRYRNALKLNEMLMDFRKIMVI